jgi:hypothetical protein
MRTSAAFVLWLAGVSLALAQTSPAQMGITPSTTPEVLQTLDRTKTWVPIGNVDPATHAFTPVGGGGGGSITAGTTPTTGFTAGQLMMSDGTKAQGASSASGGKNTIQFAGGPMWMYGYAAGGKPTIEFTRDAAGYLDFAGVGLQVGSAAAPGGVTVSGGAGAGGGYYGFTANSYLDTPLNLAFMSDGTGIAGLHNSNVSPQTSPVALRVYNTATDASNGEWGALDWQTTPNVLTIGAQANGTGAARGTKIVGGPGPTVLDVSATATGWVTTSNFNFTGTLASGGVAGVSCTAGTVSAATMVVTKGIVTHC